MLSRTDRAKSIRAEGSQESDNHACNLAFFDFVDFCCCEFSAIAAEPFG